MTGLTFEERVARWYRPRPEDDSMPDRLRSRVLALPEQRAMTGLPLALTWRPRSAVLIVVLLATLLLVLAMTAAGMVPSWWADRSLSFPASLDACTVLRDAVNGSTTGPYGDGDHGMTAWNAHVCVNDGWDSGWDYRHLLLRVLPTSTSDARSIIADASNWRTDGDEQDEGPTLEIASWTDHGGGVWTGCPRPGDFSFLALAVSAQPFFFIVTGNPSEVRPLAVDVSRELGLRPEIPESLALPPTCIHRP
jgi:hypothetical protein